MGNLDDTICKILEIEFYDELKDLEKDSSKVLDKKKLIEKIISFFKSEKILVVISLIFLGFTIKTENCGILLGIIFNNPKDKFYYFQILFQFFEEFYKSNIDNYFKELSNNFKENKENKENKQIKEFNEKIKNKKEIIFIKKFENNKKYDFKIIKENANFLIEFTKFFFSFNIKNYIDFLQILDKYIAKIGKKEAN